MHHVDSHFWFTTTFRAYGREHTGELVEEGGSRRVQLIHLSRYDARLRLEGPACLYTPGRTLELRVTHKGDGHSPVCTRAAVHWIDGDEIGLTFPAPLEVSSRELQALVD